MSATQTEHAFNCERCRARVDGIYNADPAPVMDAMGWHLVAGKWLCSKLCVDWYTMLAKRAADAEVKAVVSVNDRAYQNRRSAHGAVLSAPINAAKK